MTLPRGLAVSLLVVLAGCGSDSEPESSEPAPSPPAFVFVSDGDDESSAEYSGLFTAEADGSGVRQLTLWGMSAEPMACGDEPGAVGNAEWSPNGTHVAFDRVDPCSELGALSIWTIRATGTELRRLTAPSEAASEGPTWSPDGRRIAYVERLGENGAGDLYVMNADGSGKRRLTRRGDLNAPAWSPDGEKIALEVRPSPSGDAVPSDIFVLDLGNRSFRRLTRSRLEGAHSPRWSPDGRRVAYSRGFDPADVFVVDPDGTNDRKLTRHPETDECPVWSPDGTEIAFGSGRREGAYGIFVIAADGTGRPRFVVTSDDPCGFDWTAPG